jgi:hypothetical protein
MHAKAAMAIPTGDAIGVLLPSVVFDSHDCCYCCCCALVAFVTVRLQTSSALLSHFNSIHTVTVLSFVARETRRMLF